MRKIITAILALSMLLACIPMPALAQTGETEAVAPETVPGIVRGSGIPVILYFLDRDDEVEVLSYVSETLAIVKTQQGEGMVDVGFLRFPGEEYEPHNVYSASSTGLYPTYDRLGEPKQILGMNTVMEVLEELEDCIYVKVGEETGFVSEEQFSENQYKPGFIPQDGGDITMADMGRVQLLSDVTLEPTEPRLGAAQSKIPGVPVIKRYCGLDEQVDILKDQEYIEPIEGYLEIYDEDTPAYISLPWVQQESEADYEAKDVYAGIGCKRFDNNLLWGKKRAEDIPVNTVVTVVWDTGEVACVRLEDGTYSFIASSALRTTPFTSSGSSGSDEWTPAAM